MDHGDICPDVTGVGRSYEMWDVLDELRGSHVTATDENNRRTGFQCCFVDACSQSGTGNGTHCFL